MYVLTVCTCRGLLWSASLSVPSEDAFVPVHTYSVYMPVSLSTPCLRCCLYHNSLPSSHCSLATRSLHSAASAHCATCLVISMPRRDCYSRKVAVYFSVLFSGVASPIALFQFAEARRGQPFEHFKQTRRVIEQVNTGLVLLSACTALNHHQHHQHRLSSPIHGHNGRPPRKRHQAQEKDDKERAGNTRAAVCRGALTERRSGTLLMLSPLLAVAHPVPGGPSTRLQPGKHDDEEAAGVVAEQAVSYFSPYSVLIAHHSHRAPTAKRKRRTLASGSQRAIPLME